MKTVFLAAMTALPILCQAQKSPKILPLPDNGIYLTASDFRHRKVADGFDNGQPGYRLHDEFLKHAVKISQPMAREIEIPTNELWGERINDVDYRRVDGELYRVEHADRVFIYTKVVYFNQASQPLYYFSREVNSPIYAISTRNLDNVYYDQPEKKAFFDDLENLGNDARQQAVKLTQLFYTNVNHTQATASAE